MMEHEEKHKCELCGLNFHSEEELERHMREHERTKELFKCEKCKSTFKTKEELEKHINELHSP